MRGTAIAVVAVLGWGFLSGAGRAEAGLVFFTNEAAFNAAAPGLSTQTFASANIAPIGLSVFANPLNSSTNNSVFASGSILPGLSFFSSASHGGQDLGAVSAGIFGNPAKALYNNFGGDSFDIGFNPSVLAVGIGALNPAGSSVTASVLAPGGSLLGSQAFSLPTGGAEGFVGVIATNGDRIGQINLLGSGSQIFAGADRVLFGSAVPEPASLLTLSLGLATVAGLARRRRKVA